jgi:CubicO group peptidase (beta-lactamase class C family)
MPTPNVLEDIQAYADSLIQEHRIPAVSLAIWKDGTLHRAAAGILNLNTGVPATTDSIFQIGSITKVMTTCLVMQLVDEGKVDLDAPVIRYVRDFLIADAKATHAITVRQLLNHTSGMTGDFFPDDHGAERNLIARYIDRCNLLPQIHPVGEMYSYCNAAFVVAGRLVEIVRGMSWYQAMQEFIYTPLGMTHAIADPKDVLRFSTAMGHVADGKDTERWVLPERAYLTLGVAPAGTTPTMRAADLITFARAHLDGGLSVSGQRWLSAAAVKAMQAPQVELPKTSQVFRNQVGLGWGLSQHKSSGVTLINHGGATTGCLAMLQMVPERSAALTILLNGFRLTALSAITKTLLNVVAGVDAEEPPPPTSRASPKSLKRYAGRYESFDSVIDVVPRGEELTAHIVYKIDPLPPQDLTLKFVEDGCFAVYLPTGERSKNIAFVKENAAGVPQYLYYAGRLTPRSCGL